MPDANRLPRLAPRDLTAAQRELYDVFVSGPRQSQASFFPVADTEGILSGPYRTMLLSPPLGGPLERLGRAVRYQAALSARLRELAILTVAHATENDVEWAAHERLAAASGVPEVTLSTLRGARPTFTDSSDELVHRFVHDLLTEHTVSDELFEQIAAMLGVDGVFELVVTSGYYQVIAHLNTTFAVPTPTTNSGRSA